MSDFGRMRLREEQALVLREMLGEARHRLVIRRADAKDNGEDYSAYQKGIKIVTDMSDELERMMLDEGWLP